MKQKLAVVGTGIAGMGISYFLEDEYDLTIYEKNSYVGGHTNTVDVEENGKQIPIDTGFIVFNKVTYPNLLKLFETLQVPYKKSNMSFSVQHTPTSLEFTGSGLNGLFIQRKNLFNLRYIKLLLSINRFNLHSPKILDNPKYENYTLGEYIEEEKLGRDLLDFYLVPMSSAVWSTPPELMLEFPATSLVRFFYNHGFLGLNTQHQWYTVEGGSREYVKRITKNYASRIRVSSPVTEVFPEGNQVAVVSQGKKELYDRVVLATHGDTSLKLLKQPTKEQIEILKEFHYQKNIATLHTDESCMPKKKAAWSSWNYKLEPVGPNRLHPSTIYWMNQLQGVSKQKNYFVSINDPGTLDRSKILREIEYEHPLFSLGAVQNQPKINDLNAKGPIYFTGSYYRYGFHEDAFLSSVVLAKTILGRDPWKT